MTLDTQTLLVIVILALLVQSGFLQWALISRGDNRAQTFPVPPVVIPPPSEPVQPPVVARPSVVQPPIQPPPSQPPAIPPIVPPVVVPSTPPGSDFDRCLALVLKYEGGNDDDPRDPGGRTSRGILQSEWDTWRQTHAGLPSDVWQAPQDQIDAIYKEQYWNPLYCDSLPPGVDLAVFDYGVNSGISRSAKLLQTLVGSDVDGEIGPDTIAATAKADPVSLVGRFCDARLAFLQGLSTWGTFGKGWTSRVVDVRKEALAMASGAPQPKLAITAPISAGAVPAWLTLVRSLVGTHAQNDNAVIMAWPKAIAAKYPDMADYCARYVHDSVPWCGLTVAYVLAMSGIRPQFGATDTDKFLWADAWRQFGTAVDTPQPGDILVFKWAGGGEHVTIYDHEEDDAYYHCTGGNQGSGHVVSTEAMPMANCIAIRRPPQ